MDIKEFSNIVKDLDNACNSILLDRAEAYADEDRLSNFKQIAALTGVSPSQACMVLQAKHIVALSKAVRENRLRDLDKYIIDIINYQRLLKALLVEANEPLRAIPLSETPGYVHTQKRAEAPK